MAHYRHIDFVTETEAATIRTYNKKRISEAKYREIHAKLRRKINEQRIAEELGVVDIYQEIH